MTRQEVFDRIDHIIRNGNKRDRCKLLDVVFYKEGTGQLVVIVEHFAYSGRTFKDDISVFESKSPSEAIGRAIGRHANPDEITHDASVGVNNANARIENL